jgi:endoglucanase
MTHRARVLIPLFVLALPHAVPAQTSIRINQLGYTPRSLKYAVLASETAIEAPRRFFVCDALTDSILWESGEIRPCGPWGPFQETWRLDFTRFEEEGGVFIRAGSARSPLFRINSDVYDGASDFLLGYVRQQQCGYNPFLRDSCHTRDGFITGDPTGDGVHVDVVGGWHDAADYLRYVTTSATATFQMLFAYRRSPAVFGDSFDRSGDRGANGVPDILDAARWGLDWLLKMNPSPSVMFNQVADDRDHLGFRLPTEDTVTYGRGVRGRSIRAQGPRRGARSSRTGAPGSHPQPENSLLRLLSGRSVSGASTRPSRRSCWRRPARRLSWAWCTRVSARLPPGGPRIFTKRRTGSMTWSLERRRSTRRPAN